MNKRLIGVTCVVVIAAIGAGLWYLLSPAQVARRAIERYASETIGTRVRVERMQLSLEDGSGIIGGFSVSNPEGFRSASVFEVESIKLTVDVSSLDKDVVVIRALSVVRPTITIESGQAGSNFERLINNIQHYVETPGPPDSRERKFVIERLVIHAGTVRSVPAPDAGQPIEVGMPQVSVSNIGLAKGGIAASRLPVTMFEIVAYHARRALPSTPASPKRGPGL
jgi:hypothetical protein